MSSLAPPPPHDETAAQALAPLLATTISFTILNTVFIILRFYTVLFLRRKRLGLTWDDWFLLPSWICNMGICIVAFCFYHTQATDNPPYTGHEEIKVPWRIEGTLKCVYALLQFLVPAYAFTRFSILALYLRVFSGRTVRILSYVMIVFISCQWVSFSLASLLQCDPVSFYWNKFIPGGKCIDINKFNRAFTPVNISADTIIIALPLPSIWRMSSSKLQKVGYTLILGLGSFALAASIVRCVTLETNDTTTFKPVVTNLQVEWLVVEPSVYLITACSPTMHPLFRLFAPPQLRGAAKSKIAGARQRISAELKASKSLSQASSFTRLREADASAHSPTIGGKPPSVLGNAGGVPPSEVQANAEGNAIEATPGSSAMPLRDLRQVEDGEAIMVRTEIITSQEQMMEDVIGF